MSVARSPLQESFLPQKCVQSCPKSGRLPLRKRRCCRTYSTAVAASGVDGAGAMQRVNGVGKLIDKYSFIVLDQFGVLHDGKVPYPHAAAAIKKLADAGKQIVILSNSSRRSGGTLGKLSKMGFDEEWFAGAITSGEMTHRYLATRPTPWWQQLGSRCIHITWSSRGPVTLEGLGLQVVTDPAAADFILAHGTEALGLPDGGTQDMSLQQLEQLLQQCAEVAAQQGRELPMIVANPDLVTVDGAALITMPGTLAQHYRRMGGRVQLMGKPDGLIYDAVRELLIPDGDQAAGTSQPSQGQLQQWLAIGDSLEHDIAGAQAAGLSTLFIAGGIHAAEVDLCGAAADSNESCSYDQAALTALCQSFGVSPTYTMPFLQP